MRRRSENTVVVGDRLVRFAVDRENTYDVERPWGTIPRRVYRALLVDTLGEAAIGRIVRWESSSSRANASGAWRIEVRGMLLPTEYATRYEATVALVEWAPIVG